MIDITKLRELAQKTNRDNKSIFEDWFKRRFNHLGQLGVALALKKGQDGSYVDSETNLMFSAFDYGKMLSDHAVTAAELVSAMHDGMEQNLARLRKIEAAARNLAKVKGRHNSEIAMNQLLETLK